MKKRQIRSDRVSRATSFVSFLNVTVAFEVSASKLRVGQDVRRLVVFALHPEGDLAPFLSARWECSR